MALSRAGKALSACHRTRVSAVVLACLSVSLLAHAQDEPWQVVAEEMEIQGLLDFCAQIRGIGIGYDPTEIEGTVTIRSGPGVSADELWTIANRQLATRGLATVQVPGSSLLSVVKLEEAAGLARVETGGLDDASAGYVKVLRSVDGPEPADVTRTLGEVLAKEGTVVTSLSDGRHVVIAGLKPQVTQGLEVLDVLDRSPPQTVIEEVPARHLSPIALTALVESVSQKRKAASQEELVGSVLANPGVGAVLVIAPETELAHWRALIDQLDQAEEVVTRNYAPKRFGLTETAELVEKVVAPSETGSDAVWRVVRDELTGTLVVTAAYSKHQEIEMLFDRLEETDLASRRVLRSFPIEHRDVDELVDLLEGLLEGGVEQLLSPVEPADVAGEEAVRPVEASVRAFRAPPDARGGELTLSADKGTNRLLAFGDARLLRELEELIGALDVAHPQVMIETLVVSLTESEMRDLGIELRGAGVHNDRLFELASVFGLGAPELSETAIPSPAGLGATGVVLNPGTFSAVLRALEGLNEGRSLSIPKVLVANHQDATLDSVLQTPYLSTNATNTVATTSLGGTSDAGTSVRVTPHLADGDQLRLDYSVSISTFVGEAADPSLPPPRQENQLSSIVSLPDGHTIVVGGLDLESETETTTKTPVLGSLPIMGGLFRNTSTTWQKSRFFVFIRCNVIRGRGFEDLKYMSQEAIQEAGIESDWPVLEPRIIR